MKVIFLGYRQWSLKVFDNVKNHKKISKFFLCQSSEDLKVELIEDYDLLITCGWSEELGKKISSKIKSIGVHCAQLDRYSYGTPIQNQIIDGITMTKHRIFDFIYDKNSNRAHTHNRLYSHEVDLDLSGNMDNILKQMTETSIILFNQFLNDYPKIDWKMWPEENIVRKKRVPIDSKISKDIFLNMNTLEMYNFFRCLELPYPNGYFEDKNGKFFIEKVRYEKKNN